MAAPEKKIRRLQDKHAREDRQHRENGLKQLIASFDGRRLLWLLLEDARVFGQPFSNNALETAFRCGEQNFGQRLLADITETAPDAFLVMLKENRDVNERRTADLASSGTDTYYGAGDGADEDGAEN